MKKNTIKEDIIEEVRELTLKSDFINMDDIDYGWDGNYPNYETGIAYKYLITNGWLKYKKSKFDRGQLPSWLEKAHGNKSFMFRYSRKIKIENILKNM